MTGSIQLFQTPISPCPYLDDRDSCNYIIDPGFEMTPAVYDFLLAKGFRRSAGMVYRPACPDCKECKSTRVPVPIFKPNRSQRRAWRRVEAQISIQPKEPEFKPEHFSLYQKYTSDRHSESDMSDSDISQYMSFLTSDWSDTIFLEIRISNELLAVAVTDRQPNSLSALYTFFDPEQSDLSPGVISILAQLELARQFGVDWLYLGYWIRDCQKMSYKIQYRPIQYLEEGHWHLLER